LTTAATGQRLFESQLGPILAGAYRFAHSLTRNGADAEDLIQEAALLAFRSFASFQSGTNFKAWFYKILTNCHFGHCRRNRRQSTVDVDDVAELHLYRCTAAAGLHQLSDDPAKLVMDKLSTEQIMDALDELPAEYRVVAKLYLIEDLHYHEIAELLGCPVGTVRSRIHRGRRMLQKLLWHTAEAAGILRELSAEKGPA